MADDLKDEVFCIIDLEELRYVIWNFCGATELARLLSTSKSCFTAAGVAAQTRLVENAAWLLEKYFEASMQALMEKRRSSITIDKDCRISAMVSLCGFFEMYQSTPASARVAVATGGNFMIATTQYGRGLYSCGRGREGQRCCRSVSDTGHIQRIPSHFLPAPGISSRSTPISMVAAGARFSIAIFGPGQAYGCGDGTTGVLGSACKPCSSATTLRPIPELERKRVFLVAAGNDHVLFVVNAERLLLACGNNAEGQLGVGDYLSRKIPQPVHSNHSARLTGISCIAAGGRHSLCYSKKEQVLYTWGAARRGQLGQPDGRSSTCAREVLDLFNGNSYEINALAAGDAISLALDDRGVVYACGDPRSGVTRKVSSLMSKVFRPLEQMPEEIVDIAAGYNHALALGRSGSVYSWGALQGRQLDVLARSDLTVELSLPAPVRILDSVANIPISFISAGGSISGAASMIGLHDGTLLSCGTFTWCSTSLNEEGHYINFMNVETSYLPILPAHHISHHDDNEDQASGFFDTPVSSLLATTKETLPQAPSDKLAVSSSIQQQAKSYSSAPSAVRRPGGSSRSYTYAYAGVF